MPREFQVGDRVRVRLDPLCYCYKPRTDPGLAYQWVDYDGQEGTIIPPGEYSDRTHCIFVSLDRSCSCTKQGYLGDTKATFRPEELILLSATMPWDDPTDWTPPEQIIPCISFLTRRQKRLT